MLKKQEQLFDRFKKFRAYKCFVEDGIFDEEEWNKQAIKILYVLKDVNCWKKNIDGTCACIHPGKEKLNLCEYLLSEESPTYWKTWNNIVRWTQAIRDGGEYQRYVSKADKTYCLKTIAVLNIKKEAGGAIANTDEIQEYGKNDAFFIKEQIELYQPDIIVCCGRGKGKNADILREYVFKDIEKTDVTINGYDCFLVKQFDNKILPVVSFRHPQMWGGHSAFEKAYKDIHTIANELRNNKLLKLL